MRILYVYDGDWPRNATRPTKQTRSLARAGHQVRLIARNELRKPRRESNDWMTVVRLPSVGPRWLNRVVNFPYFFNPFWIYGIWKAARDFHAECILVRDLPLALTSIWAGKFLGIPVHYDMAEVYPEFLRSLWEFDEMGWMDHLVRNPRAAELIERLVLPRVRSVFVVSEESRERCRRLGVPDDRLVLVGNTPDDVEMLIAPHPEPPELADLRERPKLLFVGTLIGDRGVVVAVQAMPAILRAVPEAVLVIVGDGPERERIAATARDLGVADQVRLVGWRNHADLPGFYSHADIGLLPFLDGSHVRITFANKLFDYMAVGLAVLAADLPPMRRILQETDAGVLFPPGDPEALATAAVDLLRDPARRRGLGQHGQQAVLTEYRWSVDEQRLLAAFNPSSWAVPDLLPGANPVDITP
jgi:glycosyltransferase involved in cell wall biosynthesis